MKIVVTAGGTGGHIFPAISIIKKLKELYKDVEILYIGTTDRMEANIIPNLGIDYVGIKMIGLNRKNPFKNIKTLLCLFKGIKKAKDILQKFKPDVVVTTGAHTCVAMCYIAKLFKKKIIYIESFANIETKTLTGKLIYPIADVFIVQWHSMLKLYPKAVCEGWIF